MPQFFTPSPLSAFGSDLIFSMKFSQPPLLRPLFNDPPPPSDADIIYGSFHTSNLQGTARAQNRLCNLHMLQRIKLAAGSSCTFSGPVFQRRNVIRLSSGENNNFARNSRFPKFISNQTYSRPNPTIAKFRSYTGFDSLTSET